MEGITILHEFTVGGPSVFGIGLAAIVALAALAVAVWGIVMKWRFKNQAWKWREIIFALVTCLVMVAGIAWSLTWETETRYKVTIDETVPYVAFTEQFEVLGREGSIYTVRCKDGELIDNTEWFEDAVG